MAKKFLRRNWTKASRLGKGRKKKQVWRAAKGRHNKMRNKRKGYPSIVEIGYKKSKKKNEIIIVKNLNDIKNIGKKSQEIIMGKIGKKKREEIIKYAIENKIKIKNLKKEKKKENKK
jgi:large subunit ribosomal protein L32e